MTAPSRGNKALIFGLMVTGAGLVFTALGFAPATTEALPAGLGLLVFGLPFFISGVRKLRRRFAAASPADSVDPANPALGATDGRPPVAVECPNCRGPAPLTLADPGHSTCAYCHHHFALPAALARTLEQSAKVVKAQADDERHIAKSIETLAAREASWVGKMTRLATVLALIAAPVFLFGWFTRGDNSLWFAYAGWSLACLTFVGWLFVKVRTAVPSAMRRIVGRWTALKLPNVDALGCRVCGGPLPAEHKPVLRCAYCSADNLAGAEVIARVEASATHAQAGRLAIGQRAEQSEELAALAINAFVPMTLVAWFAAGAFAGSGFINLGELRIWNDPWARYALVRVKSGSSVRPCIATFREVEGGTELRFDHDKKVVLSAEKLAKVSMQEPIHPSWLVGKELFGHYGKVDKVVRLLAYPARHMGRLEGYDHNIYFPSTFGGGEVTCLAEETTGEAMDQP